MLHFDDDYFRDEVRCGFTVPAMMKRVWAADLAVLSEVLRIAGAHGITCFAAFGTLLGAVRHRGFVPWDDDLDLMVKREEYVRLFRILEKELPSYYRVYSIYTGTPNREPQGCVMNRQFPDYGSEEDRRITEQHYGCPYVIGLDIFPLDPVPDEEEERRLQQDLYSAVYDAAYRYEELSASGEMESILPRIEELTGQTFGGEEPLDYQLWRLADQIAMLYAGEKTRGYTDMKSAVMRGTVPVFPAEWFACSIPLPFENVRIPAPVGYEGFLELIYGRDYMKQQQFTATHDYPFYRKQEEWRRKVKKEGSA